MKRASLVQITACVGLLLGAGLIIYDNPAFGITYAAMSLEQAVQGSEVIVVGRVERPDAAKDLEKEFNLACVKVAKVLKNTTKESPIKVGDEVSIQVWADGVWGKVPYTKGKEGVWLLRRVPDKMIFEALHPIKFQALTKEEEIVALLAKREEAIPPRESVDKESIKLDTLGPWQTSRWGSVEHPSYAKNVLIDTKEGHAKFVVQDKTSLHTWIRYDLLVDFNRYPIAVMRYRAGNNTINNQGWYSIWMDDGTGPAGKGVVVFDLSEIVDDGKVHELRKDLRELNPKGPIIGMALGVQSDALAGVFELIEFRFEVPATPDPLVHGIPEHIKVDKFIDAFSRQMKHHKKDITADQKEALREVYPLLVVASKDEFFSKWFWVFVNQSEPKTIEWAEAEQLILKGKVLGGGQSHSNHVSLVTFSGEEYLTKQARGDEVFRIARIVDPKGVFMTIGTE